MHPCLAVFVFPLACLPLDDDDDDDDSVVATTGITSMTLAAVKFNLHDAQAVFLDLCGPDTVLVGHALHNDLRMLQVEHRRIIDTQLLFSVAHPANPPAPLWHCARQVLNYTMHHDSAGREGSHHDSVEDAQVALMLVRHRMSLLTSLGTAHHAQAGQPPLPPWPKLLSQLLVNEAPPRTAVDLQKPGADGAAAAAASAVLGGGGGMLQAAGGEALLYSLFPKAVRLVPAQRGRHVVHFDQPSSAAAAFMSVNSPEDAGTAAVLGIKDSDGFMC
jgi:hypothetical protein